MAKSNESAEKPIDFSLYGGAEPSELSSVATPLDSTRSPRRTVTPTPTAKDDGKSYPGPPQDPKDFLWLMTEEPHRSRRMAIMKAHPQVTTLMGHTPTTKYVVALVVSIQFIAAYLLRSTHPLSWKFLLTAYLVGGTANHNLFLAIHEITHNLAFKGIWWNKALAVMANLPIGVPYAAAFKKYHIEHHRYLGEDGVDTDLPSRIELLCLNNVLGKVFFTTFQIFFYALRPTFVRTQKLTSWHIANLITQLTFDFLLILTLSSSFTFPTISISALSALTLPEMISLLLGLPSAIVTYFGTISCSSLNWYPLFYLLFSSFFAGSWHPLAGHFIAEHYLWDGLEQETYSYYGPLNWLAYNVGYHNEHHDFPSIPWTRLPALRALAPEFYDNIPSHPSWVMVIINFVRDKEVGIFARAKRINREKEREVSRKVREEKVKGGEKGSGVEKMVGTPVLEQKEMGMGNGSGGSESEKDE
ncbi:hypothetical protein JAAARDRAFT_56116 [Jaapia argillacea MUCL 33604]|uniref:sphingolipid 4-desaturase n=1 Tax=Jaapia argillacea MUCL 33604 TaxID=933084 RepID=A0A067PZK6_9AGAM|nr:hypothetical protein JAAARDRAFT_56116 [Jaapia argillacea MUCL 33604]